MLNQKVEIPWAVILAWVLTCLGFWTESLKVCASFPSHRESETVLGKSLRALGFLLLLLCPEPFSAVFPAPTRLAGKMHNLIITMPQINKFRRRRKQVWFISCLCESLLFWHSTKPHRGISDTILSLLLFFCLFFFFLISLPWTFFLLSSKLSVAA